MTAAGLPVYARRCRAGPGASAHSDGTASASETPSYAAGVRCL